MTLLDAAIAGVIVLSALFAYARGIVRSLIGLAAWLAGFVAGLMLAPGLARADQPTTDIRRHTRRRRSPWTTT